MNLALKAIYVCVTNSGRYGKGYTIAEAKKAAQYKAGPKAQFYVSAAIFDKPTDAELKNLFACIAVNGIDGRPMYYQDDRTEEDTAMINAKHVGWLIVEKNYE